MADLLDILNLDEAKRAISMSTGTVQNDDVLASQVTAVSRLIDDNCGPVVQRTITNEYHEGGSVILLQHVPVASITTLNEAWGGTVNLLSPVAFGSNTTDGYYAPSSLNDPSLLSGSLFRRCGSSSRIWAAVEVTYVAGRYEDTASVDQRFKECAGAVLRRLWKREAGTWAQSATFFDDNATQYASGFFQVAKPIISEMLWSDMRPPRVA